MTTRAFDDVLDAHMQEMIDEQDLADEEEGEDAEEGGESGAGDFEDGVDPDGGEELEADLGDVDEEL